MEQGIRSLPDVVSGQLKVVSKEERSLGQEEGAQAPCWGLEHLTRVNPWMLLKLRARQATSLIAAIHRKSRI